MLQGGSGFALNKAKLSIRFFDRISSKYGHAAVYGKFSPLLFLKSHVPLSPEGGRTFTGKVENNYYSCYLRFYMRSAQNLKMMLNHIAPNEAAAIGERAVKQLVSNTYVDEKHSYEGINYADARYEGNHLVWNKNVFPFREKETLRTEKKRIFSLVQGASEIINHPLINKVFSYDLFRTSFKKEVILKNVSPRLSFKTESAVNERPVVKGHLVNKVVKPELSMSANTSVYNQVSSSSAIKSDGGISVDAGKKLLFYSHKENNILSGASQVRGIQKVSNEGNEGRHAPMAVNPLRHGNSLMLSSRKFLEQREKKVSQTIEEVLHRNTKISAHKMKSIFIDKGGLENQVLGVNGPLQNLHPYYAVPLLGKGQSNDEKSTFTPLLRGGKGREPETYKTNYPLDLVKGQSFSYASPGYAGMEFRKNPPLPVMAVESEKEVVVRQPSETISADYSRGDSPVELKKSDISRITDQVYKALEKRIRVEKEWRSSF